MAETIHMIQLRLRVDHLARIGAQKRFPPHGRDLGYSIHCAIMGLFGSAAPTPFSFAGTRNRFATVLGYSSTPGEELRRIADESAEPQLHQSCSWENFAAKPMPSRWPRGRRLAFRVRTCPVVRMSAVGPQHRKGAEVDAFLAECWKQGTSAAVDRQTVYCKWLDDAFTRLAGATLVSRSVDAFRRERLLRRTHDDQRKSRVLERPDVVFSGELEVGESEAFTRLLRRGVGRHRGFGFGMLLLSPTRRN